MLPAQEFEKDSLIFDYGAEGGWGFELSVFSGVFVGVLVLGAQGFWRLGLKVDPGLRV